MNVETAFKLYLRCSLDGGYMGKVYVRIDDRLIHGQIVVAWCSALKIKEIIAIDDKCASNKMLQQIMLMGVPKQFAVKVVTFEQAAVILKEDVAHSRLVITRFPKDLLKIKEEIMGAEGIVLGNIAKTAESKYNIPGSVGIFYLTQEDVAAVDEIYAGNANIKFKTVPTSQEKTWGSFKEKLDTYRLK